MNRITFMGFIVAENCNPNGDPIDGNRPRTTFDGHGEMSDVCLKRKIRNRLLLDGHPIFVRSGSRHPRANRVHPDEYKSLHDRANGVLGKKLSADELITRACEEWIDVRLFGQVFAFKSKGKDDVLRSDVASVSTKGCVSITNAESLEFVGIRDLHITKCATFEDDGVSDVAGVRFVIDKGVYVFSGGVYPKMAFESGATDDDIDALHSAIINMFDGDESASRPEGSMILHRLLWWEHDSSPGSCSPATLLRSVHVVPTNEFPYYKIESITTPERVKLDEFVIPIY